MPPRLRVPSLQVSKRIITEAIAEAPDLSQGARSRYLADGLIGSGAPPNRLSGFLQVLPLEIPQSNAPFHHECSPSPIAPNAAGRSLAKVIEPALAQNAKVPAAQ